jgi:DNA-binding CsgD family transcriptional regulator
MPTLDSTMHALSVRPTGRGLHARIADATMRPSTDGATARSGEAANLTGPTAPDLPPGALIGRIAEVAALHQALDGLSSRGGGTILITGEAGIGKSRLAAEARTYAAAGGALVLEGTCFPHDRGYPYAPLIELLRSHFATMTPEAVCKAVSGFADELAALLPDVAATCAPLPPTVSRTEPDRRRLVAALTQWLSTSAADQPALVIIEDLHWCDDASLDVLFSLARTARKVPLLLLATFRSDEVDGWLRGWLAQIERGRLATELLLSPLAADEVAQLMRAVAGPQAALPHDVTAAIASLAEGNPFYVEELLVSCLGGSLREPAGARAASGSAISLPRSLQIAVLERVERVSPAARDVLRIAAVAGRRFDFDLLESLVRVDEPALLSLLHELIDAGLVVEEARDRFAFRHALTCQAVVGELLAREHIALHRRIAEILEGQPGAAEDGRVSDLAYHFYEADQWHKAAAYGAAAGIHARRLHAPHAAIDHLSRALAAAAHLAVMPGDTLSPATVATMHRDRGRAYETVGDFDRARADYDAAAELAQQAGDRRLEWQAWLNLGTLWAGRDYTHAGLCLQRALALARELADPAALAGTLNRLGSWQANATDDPRQAIPRHEEALAIFEQLGDRHGVAASLSHLGTAHYQGADLPGSVPFFERAVALYREIDHRPGLAEMLSMLATRAGATEVNPITAPTADFAQGVSAGEEALQLARTIGSRGSEVIAGFNLAAVFGERGHYTEALALATRTLRRAEEIQYQQWLAAAHGVLGMIYHEARALATARRYLEASLAVAREVGSQLWVELASNMLARTLIDQGGLDRAEALLDAVRPASAPVRSLAAWRMLHTRALLALSRNDPATALGLIERLNASGLFQPEAPHQALVRGMAMAALGRADEAEFVLVRVRDAARTAELLPLLWRAHAALGDFFRRLARPDEARRELTAARAVIDTIAAGLPDDALRTEFLQNATTLLPRSYRMSAARVRAVQHDGLTAREREIAALVGRRCSNREIAATLTLAERTVETHVSNILNKLGVDSRGQIAVWATGKGLVATAS